MTKEELRKMHFTLLESVWEDRQKDEGMTIDTVKELKEVKRDFFGACQNKEYGEMHHIAAQYPIGQRWLSYCYDTYKRDTRVVETLLEVGLEPNGRMYGNSRTVFVDACYNAPEEVVKLLIEAGGNLETEMGDYRGRQTAREYLGEFVPKLKVDLVVATKEKKHLEEVLLTPVREEKKTKLKL
ncbi:MAG TPA: hypothetical protein VM577_15325 [Anaerovoracaceae bacterium]|nr:hypothetical protein [Anaerovoracaceae bacterium]